MSGIAITLVLLSGCPSRGYVPPEALAAPSLQISEALLEFGNKTQSEQLAKYRRAAREDLMKTAVGDFFRGNDWSGQAFERAMPKPRELLCLPRYGYLRISGPVQNITGRATAVKSLLSPPSDDTVELIKSLGKNYSVDVTTVETPEKYDVWLLGAGESCASAVRDADPFASRNYIGKESLVATVVGAKALFDAVWGIVKPAVVGTLQNVDIERRNNEIRKYFADENNVKALKLDIEHVEGFLKKEFELEQKRTAGVAVVAQAAAFEPKQFDAALAVANKNDCKKRIQRLNTLKTDPEGAACLGAVYATLASPFNAALDAADKFDASIEKQLPKVSLSSQVNTLSEIAQGKNPPEEQARAMWATLLRYATLFNTVKKTASDENREKFDAALEAFRESQKK
jgi:hypothetical protein